MNWILSGIDVYKCSTVIADARLMNMIWKEDRKWILENWYPRAIKAGFRRQAFIISEDSYSALAIKEIIKNLKYPLVETAIFPESDQAVRYAKYNSFLQEQNVH